MNEVSPDLQTRSPWSPQYGVDRLTVQSVNRPVTGALSVPGSKSYSNRALIIAALAHGPSRLSGVLKSDDSYWCIDALQRLGVNVSVEGDAVTIQGCEGAWPNPTGTLFLGASGTLARFLPGALAIAATGTWHLTAGARLTERPLGPLLRCLQQLGAKFDYDDQQQRLPFTLTATGLHGGEVSISGDTSSQFISGLLLCAPYATDEVQIHVTSPIVQQAYVKMTIDLMRQFGVNVVSDEDLREFVIAPTRYQGADVELEADASTSCYFLALAAVTGGEVTVRNLPYATSQPDIGMVDLLERMGCRAVRTGPTVTLTGPSRAQGGSVLRGGFTVSMRAMSDQAVTLAAIAPFADAPITITEVAHIRAHESDRIRAICESLQRVGIRVDEHEDGLTIYPGQPQFATLPSYDDHRIAMSLAVLAAGGSGAEILDPGCVSKTCPTYFELLSQLGVDVIGL
ncbi:3-phosphoshikimate 1-carboxyvinyltransferase [Alicyclobacillus sp. ALC3]|uniref:3-phosphoshikimate 1-carboxyvinyltransferase n=1 Tax=Alicyclobacillus sp. ALC3 TaxID=2796143 RepID=UPI002379C743|nr:3-phosphoshikimate 1-carboxyvinyltransferase [Alicyclobacillus sp. ALC3]WDL97200.1 3-phosphoshikimate 1-carboxyvinyltransferase [Alicyclobacillus sp. ALC3]